MNNSYLQKNWYALFVLTGEEDKVKERLNYSFSDRYKILVPKRRLRERKGGRWLFNTRVLFPGYVLINGYVGIDQYYSLKRVPGLLKLFRSDGEIIRIADEEMTVLSRLICNGEEIGLSDVLVENDVVRVVDGPLVSMEGIIVSVDHRKGRAKIRLNFLGDERTLDLGVSVLKPA